MDFNFRLVNDLTAQFLKLLPFGKQIYDVDPSLKIAAICMKYGVYTHIMDLACHCLSLSDRMKPTMFANSICNRAVSLERFLELFCLDGHTFTKLFHTLASLCM